jgi:Chlorophyllase enzyme
MTRKQGSSKRSKHQKRRVKAAIWLCDDAGNVRESFSIGETIFVAGHGLTPTTAYEFVRLRESKRHKDEMLARYVTDRHGILNTTLLLPYFGLSDQGKERYVTFDEANQALGGKVIKLRVTSRGRRKLKLERLKFSVDVRARKPRVFSSDRDGRLLTGIEQDKGEVAVTLQNFPAGCVRVFLVRRQFGWREGDPIGPVHTSDGTVVVKTIRHNGSASRVIVIARSGELAPGSYQFIARVFRPGWFEADEATLLPSDVVSDRRFASLVIRLPFDKRFGYKNGIVLTPQIAGHPLAHRPYFQFANNFPKGTDVYAALDPDALPQGLVSQRAAIYVIQHKTAAQWSASNSLDDISGPGMTAAVNIVPIVPGCVNWNTTLVWPNPQVPGKYDIAIDFGNNAPDPMNFVSDGTLDPPLDMIDGYVRVGFYVTEDPSLPGPYAGSIGQHDYALGTVQVPSTDTGPTPTDSLPLTATIRYPALASGTDAPVASGSFPLVVVMHGNSGYDTSYLGYNYLLDHLASHGFIAMSIYAPVGVMIETRARAILAHLGIMAQNNTNPGLFHSHIDFSKVGICGHSRGGEAVVRAARINTAETLGWQLRAGVSIAPTDYHHYGDAGIPLLVIYGSNDGDVAGTWPDRTCFNIFDETGRPRSFVFVYGATHDRFNTVWAPTALNVESDIAPSDVPNLISLTDHENVAKGYITAFMQTYMLGRDEQREYFTVNLKPSLVSGIQIHTSHQEPGTQLLDNFEQHNPNANTLGGAVTGTSLSTLAENALRTLDSHSPHVTSGGNIAWQSTAGIYLSDVPIMAKDVSGFEVLAFRITQKFGSPQNPSSQAQDLFVRLTDGGGKSRAIRVSTFTDIPYPYVRGYADLIKSALKTVRIPLVSYVIANLGAQDVDLTNIQSVSFEFNANSTGEIEIDDIEFSQ